VCVECVWSVCGVCVECVSSVCRVCVEYFLVKHLVVDPILPYLLGPAALHK